MSTSRADEICDIIKIVVEQCCGIKRSELSKVVNSACDMLGRTKSSEAMVLQVADIMVKEGLLIAVTYSVANVTSLKKSFYLPVTATEVEFWNVKAPEINVSELIPGEDDVTLLEHPLENHHKNFETFFDIDDQITFLVAAGVLGFSNRLISIPGHTL